MEMRYKAALGGILFATFLVPGFAIAQQQASPAVRQALIQSCRSDISTYCSASKPGDGTMKACLKANFRKFSSPCKTALKQALKAK
jgi:hypothetical protein